MIVKSEVGARHYSSHSLALEQLADEQEKRRLGLLPPRPPAWRNPAPLRLKRVSTDFGRGRRILCLARGVFSVPLWAAVCHPFKTARHLRYPLTGPEGS